MAETHELRLKIDASAAKRGGREFTAAINAVKMAVRDLERDSTGAFTRLRKNMDSLAKQGKMRVGGVDRQSIRDLNSYAQAQQKIVNSSANSARGIKNLVTSMRSLSGAYGSARKSAETYTASILKTNSALMRQIQLQSKAGAGARTPARTSTASAMVDPKDAAISSKAVRDLNVEITRLQKSASVASSNLTKAFAQMGAGARKAADDTRRSNQEISRMENLQLSAAAATRRAEQEAVRLSGSLKKIGDVRGATQVNQALIRLKANLAGGVGSALELRRAMDQFSQTTSRAKVSITQFNAAQAASVASAKRGAAAQRDQANAARRTEREMRSLAGANNAASQAMRRATGNMRGLENAFNAGFQAASLFRAMLGGITFGSFVTGVFKAGDALDQFRVTMEVATGSAAGAMSEMNFVDEAAARLGVNLQAARDTYSKFAISADIAGVSASKTKHIFEAVSTSMAVLGKGTQDQTLAFMALEQMMSKGTVSSEELRRQLGERLPGAVNMMAKALNVTTGELQDLLKAGAINSADALPKFADELMKRFGPGLEQATKRAGNNLQKLRNEVTKFGEEIAQSGFMQELAVQFRMLTDQLGSGDGQAAAKKLGEALANMARIGGGAAQFLIENMEEIGVAIKAIGFGIVARQLSLLVTGVATFSQQIAGYAASWVTGTKATTAAQAAAIRHTAALEANTAALVGNAPAATKASMSTAALARQQEIAVRSALKARTSTLSLAGAYGKLGAAAQVAGTKLAATARFFSAAAGPIGIAVTALLLIPGAFEAIGLAGDEMGAKVDAALARSGVAFEDFQDIVRATASQAEMNRLIADIETLSAAADELGSVQGLRGLMFNQSEFTSLLLAMDNVRGEAGAFNQAMENIARSFSGLETIDTSSLTRTAAVAADDLFSETFDVIVNKQGSAIELAEKFNRTLSAHPDMQPLVGTFDALINRALQLEAGIAATTDKMTKLYGSDMEKMTLEFANAAKQVLITGEGFDSLKDRQKAIIDQTPEMANVLALVMRDFDKAAAENQSPLEFLQTVQQYYGSTAEHIKGLRAEVVDAEKAVDQSLSNLAARVAEASSGFADDFMDPSKIVAFERAFASFSDFQMGEGLQVAVESLERFGSQLTILSPAVTDFKNRAIEQFSALTEGEQTYSRLDSILRQLAQEYPAVASEVASVSAALRENARAGNGDAVALSDLEEMVNALPKAMQPAARAALGLADGTQTAGNASLTASSNLHEAAEAADTIGGAAANAAGLVNSLEEALANLGAIDVGSMASDAIKQMNRQIVLKGLSPAMKKAKNFEFKARDEINKMFGKATEGLDPRQDAGRWEEALSRKRAKLKEIEGVIGEVTATAKKLESTEAWKAPKTGGSGGGGGGKSRKDELSDEAQALKDINDALKDRMTSLAEERLALELTASGQFKTAEAANLMAEAMIAGNGAVDGQTAAMIRQIDAAAALNEKLKTLAEDPVKKWMDSVPNWIEAGQQIEMGAIGHVKDALSEFIQTGKFDIEALGQAILGTVADIVADKAMAELANLLGRGEGDGLGGLLGGLFGSVGDDVTGPTMGGEGAGVAQGGQQAGQLISNAMLQAGQQVSTQLSQAMTQAGQQAGQLTQQGHVVGGNQAATSSRTAGIQNAQALRTATTTSGKGHARDVETAIDRSGTGHARKVGAAAGGGGLPGTDGGGSGGFLDMFGGAGGLFSMVLGAFSEGGYSNSPVGTASMPASAFRHAKHYSEGTTNTSGIPAVLHDNEAVVPLSKGRSIPVEMGGAASGGGNGGNVVQQTFNIKTPDADSFRRSQKQVTADGASAAQRAMNSNR